ncbi:MAG: pyrimidine dimer DNA glycosylase/endonuclease V [Kiritimatiellae bacterium]|nr:pyrimidine dimer DNA glycosylase/endonuclease V [Kiritimatiellia bacterium]MDD5523035.1 pyrimidine dimer DNA glycosylase/endonuclease V [Kiritimatiellia bacterium]
MRIWTIHPKYLDRQGLLALWREGLLAQKVLLGKTQGYRHHPQLERFRNHKTPVAAIATYLEQVYSEATKRGYRFEKAKILPVRTRTKISETYGQLFYEWEHLKRKLLKRQGKLTVNQESRPTAHPLFKMVTGKVRSWEKIRYN